MLVLSVAFLLGLFLFVDQEEFWRLSVRFQWHQLWGFVLALVGLVLAFSYRWHFLLGDGVHFMCSLRSTILGLGANQVLPARGGDLVRVVYVARHAQASLHQAVGALVLEKIVDLLAVALIGLGSVLLLVNSGDNEAVRITALTTSAVILAGSILSVWLARRGVLTLVVKRGFRAIRLGPVFYRHAYRALFELTKASQGHKLVIPGAVTAMMWLILYVYAYISVAATVGIQLAYGEALVLVFAGALGLAIPAAPSGIGTFHASIVSGFVLLNRPATEGLVLAVALHGLLFVAYVVPSLFLYLLTFRSVHKNAESRRLV